MLISELIENLWRLKNKFGDQNVYIPSRRDDESYELVTIACRENNFEIYHRSIKGECVEKGIIII